jgi:hypothetical protein
MAFHYQNLIQEKDYQYPGFQSQYNDILKYTTSKLRDFRRTHYRPKMKDFWEYARVCCRTEVHISKDEKFTFSKRQEKILIINNILFPDNYDFLNTLKEGYRLEKEDCENLRQVLNELNRKDKDFLDSTMEALVRNYLPSFDAMRSDLSLNIGDEFIIWKLMEIMYLDQDVFNKVYTNEKSL